MSGITRGAQSHPGHDDSAFEIQRPQVRAKHGERRGPTEVEQRVHRLKGILQQAHTRVLTPVERQAIAAFVERLYNLLGDDETAVNASSNYDDEPDLSAALRDFCRIHQRFRH